MTAPLDYLPAEDGFQDPDRPDAAEPASAKAVVVPYGLEASVSYGSGTAEGPAAILRASQQLELYDEELGIEPCHTFGIATLRPQPVPAEVPAALDKLEAIVGQIVEAGRFPLVLGGEHSLTAGAVRPFVRRHERLTILQIDAHADLRDGYLGEHFSHAAAMRRVLDHPNTEVVSVGIRVISKAEAEFAAANPERVSIFWAKNQDAWDMVHLAQLLAGRDIYVTFDIDGLDSAIMPATGTPTPGGLSYLKALSVLRTAASVGRIVGADVVELAPIPRLHACDYLAAAVANKILNYSLALPRR